MDRPIFYHSTMNGSKTANLLTSAHNYMRQGKKVMLFKPTLDTRAMGEIKSRAIKEGKEAYGIPPHDANFVSAKVIDEALNGAGKPDVVFIDEAQLLTVEQIENVAHMAIEWGIKVFVYGLLIDFKGSMFPAAIKAIETGFDLKEFKMTCDNCSNEATNHQLLIDGVPAYSGDTIHIGDEEYRSVCYQCFVQGIA